MLSAYSRQHLGKSGVHRISSTAVSVREWVAQRICGRCGALPQPGEEAVVSCSVGVAMAPEDGARYEDLVEAADQRAYRAKGLGKNQVCAQ